MMKISDFQHPLYLKHKEQLSRVVDVYSGIDSAKKYIQQFNQEDDKDYRDRQDSAGLDNFVFRTVEDIKNIIFRKSLDETGVTSSDIRTYLEKIDYTNDLNEFSKEVLISRLRDGYTFILIDSKAYDDKEVVNMAQQKALGIRPYFVNVLRQNLLGWKVDGLGRYTQIIVQESYEEEAEYTVSIKTQLKVWKDDGTVEIWRDNERYGDVIQTGLTFIPIIKIGKDDIPPLYDLTKINIMHMNRDSEVSNYTRIGGAAFLAVFGDLDGDAPKTLGINRGLRFKDKSVSDVRWIETKGTNYEMLKDRILYHEEQMKRISVSLSTEQANKTATQISKESMTGESKANDYAVELEAGINGALKLMDLYKKGGSFGENVIEVNKDFDSSILSPEMVASYRTDYLSGIISYDKLIEYLVAGEYFKEMTEEEMNKEKALLLDSGI